jgi:hypothetical protein
MLSVSDGAHTANIALLGQYAAASFGDGSTLITDPTVATQTQLMPQHA